MDERTQVVIATLLGAVTGSVLGCLYLTERGRRVRVQLEPVLDTVIDELQRTRKAVEKAREAAHEGRRTIDDILKPSSEVSSWRARDLRQA